MLEVKIAERKIKEKVILRDIEFNINHGEIIGLVGENGAGKSSIMKIITGLTKNFTGNVNYNNESVNNKFIFSTFIEQPKYMENLTGQKNIEYFSILANKDIEKPLMNLMDKWDIKKHLNKKVKNYSLGTKQKLGLIITFLFDRKYIIIDEPTNGMDDDSRRALFDYLKILQEEGRSILISSHNLNEVNDICDRVIKVKNGAIEDDNYTFSRVVTIKGDNLDIDQMKDDFNIIDVYKDNIKIEYDNDFISKMYELQKKVENIEIVSINNYYKEKI